MSDVTADNQAPPASTPFLLSKAGTWVTLICVFMLYLIIVIIMPIFALAFGTIADQCSDGQGFICTPAGEQTARMAPPTGATLGFLVAVVGCFVPALRGRRLTWLLLGYGLAIAGVLVGFAIATTA